MIVCYVINYVFPLKWHDIYGSSMQKKSWKIWLSMYAQELGTCSRSFLRFFCFHFIAKHQSIEPVSRCSRGPPAATSSPRRWPPSSPWWSSTWWTPSGAPAPSPSCPTCECYIPYFLYFICTVVETFTSDMWPLYLLTLTVLLSIKHGW